MEMYPSVLVHEIASGNDMTGVAPTAVGTETYNGRIVVHEACTDGGLVTAPDRVGHGLSLIFWNLPGVSDLNVSLVDPDGFEYLILSSTAASGTQNTERMLIPPLWKIKATCGALTGDGRIGFYLTLGWNWFINPLVQS